MLEYLKVGARGLKSLKEFKDNFIFENKYTNKNLLIYNDEMEEFTITDYRGKKYKSKEKYGCCLVPTTYELGKSEEYTHLLSDDSSARAIYEESEV